MNLGSITKWIFFALSILMAIVGIIGLFGLIIISKHFTTRTFVGVIVLVVLYLFIGILNSWCVKKENVLGMKVGAIFILVTFIYVLLLNYVIIDVDKETAATKSYIEKQWAEEIKVNDSMENIQQELSCCGKDSPDDYENILHRPIPQSCYNFFDGTLYKKGCLSVAGGHATNYTSLKQNIPYYIVLILMCAVACYLVVYFTRRKLDNDPQQ